MGALNRYTRKMRLKALLLFIIISCLTATTVTAQRNVYSDDAQSEVKHFRIYYPVNKTRLFANYMDNAQNLDTICKYLKESPRVDSIVIYSYSSPEGPFRFNSWLSKERGKTAKKYIMSRLPGNKQHLDSIIHLRPEAENWQGLRDEVMATYHRSDRNDVLTILDSDASSDEKKRQLKRLAGGTSWQYIIKNIMPQLRYATWISVWLPIPPELPPVDITTEKAEVALTQPDIYVEAPVMERSTIFALKTNLLYDLLLVPNIGLEFCLGDDLSLATNWHYAWWNTDSWYWRTYGGEIALRKWFGKAAQGKRLTGHHLGIYAQALTYDFLVGDHGYQSGDPGQTLFDRASYAFGVEYGYSMPIARRLNLDFVIGLGYQGGKYNEYSYIDDCYVWESKKQRNFWGPTKAEVSLVWLLGQKWRFIKKGGNE